VFTSIHIAVTIKYLSDVISQMKHCRQRKGILTRIQKNIYKEKRMKVQFNMPALFTRIMSSKYNRIGGASIRVEEITTGVNKGALLVMFPPTGYKMDIVDSIGSWLVNFAAWCLPYRNMKRPFLVHAGFMGLYEDVREYLFDEVEKYMQGNYEDHIWAEKTGTLKTPEHKIIVTGYSQGAALATIAHEDLFFHGFDVCGIVFASPRVFIGVPAKRFKNLHRVAVRGDIVTKVPAWPYTHVGQHYFFGDRCQIAKIEKHYAGEYLSELVGINFDEAKAGKM